MDTVSYDRRGVGPPVVLLHGIGSSRRAFDPIVDLLAQHHDVISVDLPGFGSSDLVPGVDPTPYGYAAWLDVFLGDLGVARPHVVGNSLGGAIALEMGRQGSAGQVTAFSPIGFWRAPGQALSITLIAALHVTARFSGRALRTALRSDRIRRPLVATVYGRPERVDAALALSDAASIASAPAFSRALRGFTRYSFDSGDLGELESMPVTIAWGARDVVLPRRTQSRRARTLVPRARSFELPGCGHVPFNDDPGLCADLVLGGLGGGGEDHTNDGPAGAVLLPLDLPCVIEDRLELRD
ncbi:MAG TPA: alpha/beta hydrolase [Nocardioidaceae bacterium]|nr:alpha/beta hydrolase [Nocardioidaceae bacterium]